MKELTLIIPGAISERLKSMVEYSTKVYACHVIKRVEDVTDLSGQKIVFAVELGTTGINTELCRVLDRIMKGGSRFMEGSMACVLVSSESEYFTRAAARQIILYANMAGCAFPGRPLAEATGSLENLRTMQKVTGKDLNELLLDESRIVVERLMEYERAGFKNPRLLTLHASNYETSNTFTLWNMVRQEMSIEAINEIHIENGSVTDCKGCKYKACKHYSQQSACFYGGIMVDEVYPAILDCNVLIFLCPNYNDSISANISAVINRLTALFRRTKFFDKYIYAIIVSGHSGSDILAQQLISALNINKTFMLPPRFAMMETANDMGAILKSPGIGERAAAFAKNIESCVRIA